MQVIEGGCGDRHDGNTRVTLAKTSVPLNVVLAAVIGFVLADNATFKRQTIASLSSDQVGVQRRCADFERIFQLRRFHSRVS
jgi:hypothetical protein